MYKKTNDYYEYLKDKYSSSFDSDRKLECPNDIDNETCKYTKEDECLNNKSSKNYQCNENKYGCCPDMSKLRKILSVYKKNNISLFTVISESSYFNVGTGISNLYVKDINKDMVYLSLGSASAPARYIIPLNQIKFIATTVSSEQNRYIENIVNNKSKEMKKCCAADGIVNAVKDAANYFQSVRIAISDIGSVIISQSQTDSASFIILRAPNNISFTLFVFLNMHISAVSDEIILISSTEFNGRVVEFVIPTCAITGVENLTGVQGVNGIMDSNGRFNISNDENTSIVILDKEGKMINLSDMGVDIKGKSIEEIIR